MEGSQGRAMTNKNYSDAALPEGLVEVRLLVHIDGARAFVEYCLCWPPQQHPCNRESLLLAG